jgi:hypothetical protein
MRRLIRRVLTRRISLRSPRGRRVTQVEVEPSDRLVYGVYFGIIALLSLTALEALYLVVLQTFSSEIFAAITLVIGTILGAFFGQKG